jgi:hypothetical protein
MNYDTVATTFGVAHQIARARIALSYVIPTLDIASLAAISATNNRDSSMIRNRGREINVPRKSLHESFVLFQSCAFPGTCYI